MLTESHGGWSPAPSAYDYKWERCNPSCTPIPGASSQTYLITPSDVGDSIVVQETAIDAAGASLPVTSAPTATVGIATATSFVISPSPPVRTQGVTMFAAVSSVDPHQPAGTVTFESGGTAIGGCGAVAVSAGIAICQASFSSLSLTLSATYNPAAGSHFIASASNALQVNQLASPPPILGTVRSTMQWTFFVTRNYTKAVAMFVNSVPTGAIVVVQCRGKGCPFHRQYAVLSRVKLCTRYATRTCRGPGRGALNLIAPLRRHRLRVGARLTIEILVPNWIGKYYQFTIRSSHAPRVLIACVAPGRTHPGVGC